MTTKDDFDNFEGWVEEGLSKGRVDDVVRLTVEESDRLCESARERFSSDQGVARWWEALRRPLVMINPADVELTELLSEVAGRCWLIPETGRKKKPAYGLNVRDVPRALKESPVDFNYYVVGPEMDWILMLSDHDHLYVLGSLVATLSSKGDLYE